MAKLAQYKLSSQGLCNRCWFLVSQGSLYIGVLHDSRQASFLDKAAFSILIILLLKGMVQEVIPFMVESSMMRKQA